MPLRGETGSASWIGVGGQEGPEKQQVKTRRELVEHIYTLMIVNGKHTQE